MSKANEIEEARLDIRIKALKKNLEEFLPEKVADEDQEHRKRTKSRRSYINGGGSRVEIHHILQLYNRCYIFMLNTSFGIPYNLVSVHILL